MNNRCGQPDNHSIPTDDAWDYIAKMLSPDEPARCTQHDSWLINSYHPPNYPNDMHRYRGFGDGPKTFPPRELIPQVDRAYFRLSLMLRVSQWFDEKGIDIEQPTIPKHLFEAAVQAEFGQLPPEPVKSIEKGAAKAKPCKPKQPRMYKRYAADDALVAEAIEGLKSEKYPNVWRAALALAPRAEGSDHGHGDQSPAKVFRLNTKIGNAYKNLKTPQNISKQIK
jgi:hypothetical protein